MHTMDTPTCQDERRRHQVRQEGYNGFDYLEVNLQEGTLTVYLLAKLDNPNELTPRNFIIHGGRRVRDIRIIKVETCTPPDPRIDDCLVLAFDKPGDYSTYTLCIVALDADGRPTDEPYPGFDRRYACLDFTFAVDCPSDLDCQQTEVCQRAPYAEPEINYLAKDYASFRQLILDRLALIMPDWKERHIPDLGITLVELLAYTGDYLSYYQDAVATEAYLDTARQRISVRRHARLVDYHMHEGSNARAWLCLVVDQNVVELDPADTTFLTQLEGYPTVVSYFDEIEDLLPGRFETFAPLYPGGESTEDSYRVRRNDQGWTSELVKPQPKIILRQAHNQLRFYTWGDQECCLPQGTTEAWLLDGGAKRKTPSGTTPPDVKSQQSSYPTQYPKPSPYYPQHIPGPDDFEWTVELQPGDFLIFEEVRGPKTGIAGDADPSHRHVVRLMSVERDVDPLYTKDGDPNNKNASPGLPVLRITWDPADALTFPLCISAPGGPPDCKPLNDVSVARGNVILVDHGRPAPEDDLSCVTGDCIPGECECERPGDVQFRPRHFRPRLTRAPLVFSQPLPAGMVPASGLLKQDPRQAMPALRVLSFLDPKCRAQAWIPVSQKVPLLQSGPAQQGPPDKKSDQQQQPHAKTVTTAQEPLPAERWLPQYDLIDSSSESRHFVAEIDNEGQAYLRFGDGDSGKQPTAHLRFLAAYRIGGGPEGNVGAEMITHLVYRANRPAGIVSVRNPLPASGATFPQPISEVKMFAPQAFRNRLERAVLASDYADIVLRDFSAVVQRAHAELRWSGSGYEVLVAVDAFGGGEASPELLDSVKAHLQRYRRIGHDLVVRPAVPVGLILELEVCVSPEYLVGHVKAAVLDIFSSQRLPGGALGFFHQDRLTFGQNVLVSEIVAAAQDVPGVLSVVVTGLRRIGDQHDPNGAIPDDAVVNGFLALGPLEIARLDNDPGQPENGRLILRMRGGR
jgi:hypothetical protein